ncbi:hypothetical protein ALICE_208 [Mycobacterium phage Alice]|uniref:Uncharacterized protein n=4 Tax=Bixzunavirus TaxID=680114 RepID=A0A411AZF1_9CAUD|nr:hypothetical protein HYRO_209 [Mycobacterium phage HyRo]YP_009216445.1 hypothetical protein ALICE_208 [Mycobacterium phage Alice]AXN54010.1 hypothetical protein SEA_RABINOVISH_214 [Mycobacterium phage Rabinovish]QAX93490.1 hypothetical protein SEA_STUBBY_205 [Mycobacterium phage Stubby]QOP67041.1 hypothetical protein PBI_SHIFA_198 [Mycobacterium phage Shifa]AEJ94434.1 hypothetical protein ALICE_208 [Mycobacterium phage Alice]ALA48376.1 hypothetical protein HYRO_209 [Mycobacterium phage HyR
MASTIAEVQERLSGTTEESIEISLGDLKVDEESRQLTITDQDRSFPLDERVERGLAKHLGIPKAYLDKCPPVAKAYNINFWLRQNAGKNSIIETINDTFVSIHRPNMLVVPLTRVVNTIATVLDPSYEVVNLIHNDSRFQVDILTPKTIEVAPWEELEDRNPVHHATVGDITHGGLRFTANPIEPEDPVIQTYLHRLWCSNGATSPEKQGQIALKGKTVDDIIAEMEIAMRKVVGDLDAKLEAYAALATQYPPGSKEAFARQLGQEHKIPARVLNKILDRIEILPEGASLYDILNVFTSMAHEEGIKPETVLKLQQLGGQLAFETEAVTHRCGQCERLLP